MDQVAHIPRCVGIILDGNRRFAKAQGLPQLEGHRRGASTLEKIVLHMRDRGIPHIAAYVFSTENWERSPEEVSYLMELIIEGAKEHITRLKEEGVRVRVIGERTRLSARVRAAIESMEEGSTEGHATTLWLCLSYGGRTEIIEAAQALAADGTKITEESLRDAMWSKEMPDPDLIIRTSGEMRLSNFLLWQAAYSELFFTDTLWPDFSPEEFDRILDEYGTRERRRGR
jgi:undecaprenyl diphosphate synthase